MQEIQKYFAWCKPFPSSKIFELSQRQRGVQQQELLIFDVGSTREFPGVTTACFQTGSTSDRPLRQYFSRTSSEPAEIKDAVTAYSLLHVQKTFVMGKKNQFNV